MSCEFCNRTTWTHRGGAGHPGHPFAFTLNLNISVLHPLLDVPSPATGPQLVYQRLWIFLANFNEDLKVLSQMHIHQELKTTCAQTPPATLQVHQRSKSLNYPRSCANFPLVGQPHVWFPLCGVDQWTKLPKLVATWHEYTKISSAFCSKVHAIGSYNGVYEAIPVIDCPFAFMDTNTLQCTATESKE